MIAAVVYSESGGTYKTTVTANVAAALERMGFNTLVIDLDPQEGNLTSLFDAGENRDDPNADNLVRHILEMPEGDFDDLIETTDEGIDIIPSHDMLGDFTSNLEQKISYEIGMKDINREDYPRYELLYNLLWKEHQLNEQYDAILIDPNARAEDLLYNAIYALRTLICPITPSKKGSLSLSGVEELAGNMGSQLGVEIGLSCVALWGVGDSNAHQLYKDGFINDESLSTPVVIRKRASLFDEMWEANGSAFKVIEERWKTEEQDGKQVSEPGHRRVRDRELETITNLLRLAEFIARDTFGEAPPSEVHLDIDGRDSIRIDLTNRSEAEVSA